MSDILAPDTAPRHGFAGYLDQIVNPTTSLGQLGQALLVGGGGPLGDAFQYLGQRRQQQQNDALEQQYKAAQIAHLSAGPEPDAFTKTLIAAGIDPHSPQAIGMYRTKAQHEADPILTQVVVEDDGHGGSVQRLVGVPYSRLEGDTPAPSPALDTPFPPTAPDGLAPGGSIPNRVSRWVQSLPPEMRDAGISAYKNSGGQGWDVQPAPPANAAQIMHDAAVAISRGADPVKVHARLRQMGIE